MHHEAPPRPVRTNRKAIAAGVVASLAIHGALFAFVGFGAPTPPEERVRPAPRDVPLDAPAIRLLTIRDDAPQPELLRPLEAAATVTRAAAAEGADAAGAPAAASDVGGAEPEAPPVLLTFTQPSPSPLLLASAVEPVSAESPDASARAATYTPGGVRQAKVGWSGQEDERARDAGRIRRALSLGTGDGHCPVRPPRNPARF